MLEKARMGKAQKRAMAMLEGEKEKRRKAESALSVAATAFPAVAKVVGLPSVRPVMNEDRAVVLQRLAFAPAIRGSVSAKKTQDVAVSSVDLAGLALQQGCVQRVLFEGCADASSSQGHRTTHVVHCLGWQWDETSQRIQPLTRTGVLPGEKTSHGQFSTQVMMQNGRLHRFVVTDGAQRLTIDEPVFARALVLEHQSSDLLLEGMAKSIPIDMFDVDGLRRVASKSDAVILTFRSDRAAANFKVLQWLWRQFCAADAPVNIFPHAEVCFVHGFALVKT